MGAEENSSLRGLPEKKMLRVASCWENNIHSRRVSAELHGAYSSSSKVGGESGRDPRGWESEESLPQRWDLSLEELVGLY